MKFVARLFFLLSSLLAAGGAFADAEVEFNNTAGTANTLTSGVTMNGHLSSASDVDYFKITVGSSGTLEIRTSGYPSADIEVLNPSQQLIGTGRIWGTDTFSVGFAQSGTYYLRVVTNSSYSDTDPYDLTVTISSAISAETEFNDSAGQANTLTSGVTMNGHLSSASDVDYFKITVGSSGTLEIRTSGYPSADIEVLNPSQQLIGTGRIWGTDTFSVGFAQSGTYYLRVVTNSSYSDTDPYDLTVTITGDPPSAPTIALQSKTYSSATISISPNEEGAAPITSYTTTCEAPKSARLPRTKSKPDTYQLGEPTASGRSRIAGNGASMSIGRIYRANPDPSGAY